MITADLKDMKCKHVGQFVCGLLVLTLSMNVVQLSARDAERSEKRPIIDAAAVKSEVVVAPVITRRLVAVYRRDARRRKASGTVLVTAVVDEKERVAATRVNKTSGITSLDKSVVKSVKRWRFKPAKGVSVKAVSSSVTVPIRFELKATEE